VLTLRIATRGSPLALCQAELVADAVALASSRATQLVAVELVIVETTGDRNRDRPIGAIGGQGAFVKEVEQALLEGRADLAVHSAKDLPASFGSDELVVVAVPKRADPRDVLVGLPLAELGPGAHVATGAARRRAQLAWLRPDLRFEELRGNVSTRLAKVPPAGAVVTAHAALERLGLLGLAAEVLSLTTMLPQVGQGALAVQGRAGDATTAEIAALIDDAASHRCFDAERSFLGTLGGGCDLPVGAHAVAGPSGNLEMEGMIASVDGLALVRRSMSGPDPFELGRALAVQLRDQCGGAGLLPGYSGIV
jgi:hydroxymethylbilane synthase